MSYLYQDRRGTIKKIADFLGRSLTEKDIDNVMEHTSLENMKKNPACNFQHMEEVQKVDKTEGAFINKGDTLRGDRFAKCCDFYGCKNDHFPIKIDIFSLFLLERKL